MTWAQPKHIPRHPSVQLFELVNSIYPRVHGWDAYHVEVVELLCQGADPNFYNEEGQITFLKACTEGDGFVIHRLLKAGADVNIQVRLSAI